MHTVQNASTEVSRAATEILSVLDFGGHNFFPEVTVLDYIRRGCVYLVVDDTEPGKTLGVMILLPDDKSYKIHALAVRPDARRKGVGRTLVQYALRRCRQEGIPKLWAWSMARYGMEDFARAIGAVEVHRLQKQFFGEDCCFFGVLT